MGLSRKIVTTAYQPLGILSLAKDVGVLLSDGLFATGNISETYLQIHAVTKFDKLLKEVTLELKSSYVSTLQEQDALLLNNAIEMVYDTTDYGINLTRIYTDSVLQDNIASWVDSILGGKMRKLITSSPHILILAKELLRPAGVYQILIGTITKHNTTFRMLFSCMIDIYVTVR